MVARKGGDMSDVEFAEDVDLVDSIVLGAVEKAVRERGLSIAVDANDYLLTRLRRNLDKLLAEGSLEEHRDELEANTTVLMNRVFEIHQENSPSSKEITLDSISEAIEWLCEQFPYFVPFCP
jgi:hypothetical protein